jgi:uncharacterized protein YjbI with pentapeptide repeats
LITNRAASPLPIIQTSIPIVGFFAVAPLLLLCVYVYFHFYLQKLWEELGSLPAILPDGRPLFAKIDPWLLNDLVRSHLPKLNVGRPFLSYFQLWISVLLAWWVVPLTMLLFWARYLPRHETIGTTFHVVLLTISLTAALRLYGLAVATLRGAERKPFGWKTTFSSRRGSQTAAFAIVVGTLFGLLSWGAIMGVPSDADVREMGNTVFVGGSPLRTGHLTWAPRLMALVGYSSFANLTRADVSQKKSTWKKNDSDLDSVLRAELKGANLRYALAHGAFFAGADLSGADLSGADLVAANMEGVDLSDANLNRALLSLVVLRNAELVHANLRGVDLNPGDAGDGVSDLRNADLLLADLSNARMRNANLSHAILRGTNLDSADLSYADLSDANLINANLQGADLSGANLASADLYDADLGGANLSGANLQGARLQGDNLRGAILKAADLTHANLRIADLSGTQLNGANLTYSDFREAKNLNFETVKAALHWEQAYYDNEGLKALVLASDHNSTLAKQEKKESELLRKPKSRDLPQKNSASRGNPLESDGGQNKGGSIK